MNRLGRCLLGVLLLAATLPVVAAEPEDADNVIKHLEFLGYEVTRKDEQLNARHEKHSNVSLKRYAGGILLTAYYTGNAHSRANRLDFLELVNRFNTDAVAARYYVDKDGDLTVEGYYPGPYRKDLFGLFMENYNLSMGQLSEQYEQLKKFVD